MWPDRNNYELSLSAQDRLLDGMIEHEIPKGYIQPLTAHVLQAAAAGLTAQETATALGKTERQIERERAAAIRLLGAKNIVQAVAVGIREQVIL